MDIINNAFAQFNELFGHHIVFSVGILLFTGYFFGKLAEFIKLPSITGYIISGLVMGEYVLHIVPMEMAHRLTSITEIALGLIALTIGGEFSVNKIKRYGLKIFILTLFETIFAFTAVTTVMLLIGLDVKMALLLGAISTATAPAATVVVIKKLRARGEFVDHLYGVVAFDDALCVIIFSIVFAIVGPMMVTGSGIEVDSSVLHGFIHAIEHIFFSMLIGIISGISLHLLIKGKYLTNEILIISIAMIFLTTAITIVLGLSLLITNMVLGVILINLSSKNKRVFTVLGPLTPPIFALFFILAGMELNVTIFAEGIVVIYGLVYILTRFAGKFAGIYLSASIIKSSSRIRNYLGFCLFPQAGVAIGLVLLVQTSPLILSAPPIIQEKLVLLVNIILLSIVINELVGPAISKFGIIKGSDL